MTLHAVEKNPQDAYWVSFLHIPPGGTRDERRVNRHRGVRMWSVWFPLSALRRVISEGVPTAEPIRLNGNTDSATGPSRTYIIQRPEVELFFRIANDILCIVERQKPDANTSLSFSRTNVAGDWQIATAKLRR